MYGIQILIALFIILFTERVGHCSESIVVLNYLAGGFLFLDSLTSIYFSYLLRQKNDIENENFQDE